MHDRKVRAAFHIQSHEPRGDMGQLIGASQIGELSLMSFSD